MQLSLRSQMIAGVAALGVSAVAVAPVVQPEMQATVQRLSSTVNLTSFANPVTTLLATIDEVVYSTFDQAALPAPDELYWPDSFYTADFSFLFAPSYEGVIPDFVNQFSDGALSSVLSNLSGYVSAIGYGVNQLISGPADAIWNTPFALVTAAGYLLAGQVDLALAELQDQIVAPLVAGIGGALQAVGYVLDNTIANSATLLSNTIPGLLANVIGSVVGGTSYVVQSAVNTLGAIVNAITTLDIEGAWNAAVNGFLGPDGTLGQLVQLTGGIGIVEDVEYEEGTVPTVTIPSLRSDLTSASQRLGDLSSYGDGGIRNDAFSPVLAAAAVAAPAASEARAAAAPAAETASETPAVTASVAAESATETATAEVSHPVAGDQAADTAPAAPSAEAAPAAETGSTADKPAAPAKGKAKVSRSSAKAAN